MHDGLQSDGFIELRFDWKTYNKSGDAVNHVALLRVNPWLAYGCGEGARLASRKPGATESTCGTLQRTLRDDYVVVRRDGSDSELTVDPTPFTVVPAGNPRHPPGTRLLIVYDGNCMDAVVEEWPDGELETKDGSRHLLKVEPLQTSGWITMSKEGTNFLERREDPSEDAAVEVSSPSSAKVAAPAAAEPERSAGFGRTVGPALGESNDGELTVLPPTVDEAFDISGTWLTVKMVKLRSGCDPTTAELGNLKAKMPVTIMERRITPNGVRAYVATIPSESHIDVTIALNEFNHSVQRFPSVAAYESARANYLEDIVVREALVEDAITGNNLRIKDQTLHISTATEEEDNNLKTIPPEWNVTNVLDLVKLLLVPSPGRIYGTHSTQPVLVRAGPGTGKTWMAKQAVFTLADRLLLGEGGATNDGIRLVPIVVFVQRIIYLLREGAEKGNKSMTLLERYITSVYAGKKYESWCTMLMQAYEMRALIVLLDGVDEAAGLRDQIEDFVHKEVVPSGNRVLVTSRPEGVNLATYSKTFVVMNLCQLTNEQQRKVINIQMQGNVFFDHLLSLGEVRKKLDNAYKKVSAMARNDLETLYLPSMWQIKLEPKADAPQSDQVLVAWDPEERQKEITGQRIIAKLVPQAETGVIKIRSQLLNDLNAELYSTETPSEVSLLDRLDEVCASNNPRLDIDLFRSKVLEGMLDLNPVDLTPVEEPSEYHRVAILLGALIQKNRVQLLKEATTNKQHAERKTSKKKEVEPEYPPVVPGTAEEKWLDIVARTDEIYVVHEAMEETFRKLITKLTIEVAREDDEADLMVDELQFAELKDPIRLHEKAMDQYSKRFPKSDELPEACVPDVSRVRVSLRTGNQIKDFIMRLASGIQLSEEQMVPIKPSQRNAEDEGADPAKNAEQALKVVTEVKLMHLINNFEDLDPTHFRKAVCGLKIMHKKMSIYCEVEIHFYDILSVAQESNPVQHYDFFRKRLKGTVPESQLDMLLEEKLVFLVDATGVPVLLSLLVLIFTAGGEDLTKLPSNRIELYDIGIESAVTKRLLPGNRTSMDLIIHDWLRLFNLDRSAMAAIAAAPTPGELGGDGEGAEKEKEKVHRPSRKAALNMEHGITSQVAATETKDKEKEKDAEKKDKKAKGNEQANKQDKKLSNIDPKEVYEIFRHGAHYLREANNPEVQRTELNRIELSMPKKLVDTVMMLVNANLKTLLGGQSLNIGLSMLRHVAVSNQQQGRREFAATHVASALLVDQMNPEGITMWLHMNKEEAGLPLVKTLEAQTELAPAQYQFKHLSFQEGLFAQHLLMQAEEGWSQWETDESASQFLNNPFMNNTCRIAAGYLGTRLAKRRPAWDFSKQGTRLTEVGLQALWLINEKNETLKSLELSNNQVGTKAEDSTGLSKMLVTSTALVHLNLSNNVLGSLGAQLKAFGRGLGSNKNLTNLDVSNNQLLPDGIKVVCNALRTCTAMRDLNLSYNSPGREAALPQMLIVHQSLRSVGIVEKEPQTRSERTYWLDTRAKEAIGRALLAAPGTVQFLQCDVFSLTETTKTLNWISQAPCDAIVLAGVLRSNSVLTTLNISQGEIGDYEREEIGTALLSNTNGKVGFCDAYGLTEKTGAVFTVDLKNKDQIRSRRAFTLFAGVLRANATLTRLTLSSVQPEHIDVLADALATNTTLQELVIEQPSKTTDTQISTIPVQQLNGKMQNEFVDLSEAGLKLPDGTFQPCHRHACGVVGAILGASKNTSIRRLKIDPGGGADGGMIVDHLNRARKSSLAILDVTGIGLSDRGGAKFFETLIEGKLDFVHSFHLGRNELTDLAVGRLMVEALRSETCNIQTLDLNNNDIGAGIITQAIKSNSSLTRLDITGNPQIDDRGLGLIGDFLLQPSCLCRLRFINCFAFEVKEDKKKGLTLYNEAIGSGAMQLLCGISKYNDLIEKLDLSGKDVETDAASVLATAVKHNNTLKAIDLSSNPLSDVSLYTAARDPVDTNGLNALAEAVSVNVSLVEIKLDGGTLPVDELKGERPEAKQGEKPVERRVKFLDLSKNSLGFVSAIFIGTLLRANQNITELVLHSNQLTPKGLSFIVKQLRPTLKMLDIANTVHVDERMKGDKKGDKKNAAYAASAAVVPPDQVESLWAAVTTLNSLDKLTMDRDYLADLKDVGKLLSMKSLSLANNKLTALPEDIMCIRGLKHLVLAGNQLKVLTPAISECEMLEKLDLKSNQLRFLPGTISRLRNLKTLDASENLLTSLEPSICDMHDLEKLTVNDNPLERPPASVTRQGLGAIRKHFQEVMVANQLFFHGARMMLFGYPSAGKTTLLRAMQLGAAPKTHAYEPTMQVDMQTLVLGNDAKQVILNVWDFAGGTEYAAGTAHFVVSGLIYMLAVPAESIKALEHNKHLYIGRWIDAIASGAPQAVVIPVLTKCDLQVEKGQNITLSTIEAATHKHVAWVLETINAHVELIGATGLRVQQQVIPVSSISGGDSSMEALREQLGKLVLSDKPILPTIGQSVPRVLALTTVFIRALRDGRDPTDAARAQDLGYIPSAMSTEQKPWRWCIAYDEAHRIYFEEFVPAIKLPVTSEQALKDGIELLAAQGEVVWGPDKMIYLRPDYIARLIGPLFDTKMGNRLWIPRVLAVAEAFRAKILGFPMLDQERASVLSAVECLVQTGELREELLPVMWDPIGVKRHEYEEVLWSMCNAGMLILKINSWHGRRWIMPHRLPVSPRDDMLKTWKDASTRKKTETLRIVMPLGVGRAPSPGVLEKLLTALQGYGVYSTICKTEEGGGAHMEVHSLSFISHLLVEVRVANKVVAQPTATVDPPTNAPRTPPPPEKAPSTGGDVPLDGGEIDGDGADAASTTPQKLHRPTPEQIIGKEEEEEEEKQTDTLFEYELVIEACGKRSTREGIWTSLMFVKRNAQRVIDEVPALATGADGSLCCPKCIENGLSHQEVGKLPLKMVAKQEVVCEQCNTTVTFDMIDPQEKCVVGLASNNSLLVEPIPDQRGPPAFRRSQAYWSVSVERTKYCANRMRMGRPLEDRSSLWKLLGLSSWEEGEKLKAGGVKTIQAEMVKYCDSFESIEALKASRDEFEWTDYDWSRYLSDKPRAEDLEEDMVKPTFAAYEKLTQKALANNFDKDRTPETRTLDHFCAEKIAVQAGLTHAHVLSLRIYSSPVARTINQKLQDGCSRKRPHPYPTLVLTLAEALQKLSTAQANQRQQAATKAKSLAEAARKLKSDEDADDADKAKAAKLAAEAAEASAALQCSFFWRGVSHLPADEFTQRSGYEMGFMSVSQERAQATKEAMRVFEAKRMNEIEAEKLDQEEKEGREMSEEEKEEQQMQQMQKSEPPVLLFRINPAQSVPPANLNFLAVFPEETEWVYPPGVILENRLAWKDTLGENDDGERVECTIVEVLPCLQRKDEGKKKSGGVAAGGNAEGAADPKAAGTAAAAPTKAATTAAASPAKAAPSGTPRIS